MTRVLALLLLAVLVVLAARRLLLRARRSPLGQLAEAVWRAGATPAETAAGEPPASAALAACDGCGVHVPVERLGATRRGRLCDRCRAGDRASGPSPRGRSGS
jgi:hypothetical protein